jgi:sortase A
LTETTVRRALAWLQAITLTAGGALLLVYGTARWYSTAASERSLQEFSVLRAQLAAAQPLPGAPEPGARPSGPGGLDIARNPDQSLWGATRIAAYRQSLALHRGAPLGVLKISAVGLEVPIFEGTAEITLNRGAGRIEGTAMLGESGNVGIAGHRDGFFRSLKDVKPNDVVEVVTLDGTVRYRVTELFVVEPTDVYVLDPTERPTVTLVTCYPFYFIGEAPQRYVVRGVAESP